jgi:hypothetical protein
MLKKGKMLELSEKTIVFFCLSVLVSNVLYLSYLSVAAFFWHCTSDVQCIQMAS